MVRKGQPTADCGHEGRYALQGGQRQTTGRGAIELTIHHDRPVRSAVQGLRDGDRLITAKRTSAITKRSDPCMLIIEDVDLTERRDDRNHSALQPGSATVGRTVDGRGA